MPDFDYREVDGSAATAVILHPHPDMGGNRFHPIVDAVYRGLAMSTIRFDFASSNVDVARAQTIDAINRADGAPVVLVGYSFGAEIALTVDDDRALGWFLVAPPLMMVDHTELAAPSDPRPKFLAIPEHDQFSSPARAGEITSSWSSTEVRTIAGADHFLAGHSGEVLAMVTGWLPTVLCKPPATPD